MPGTIPSDVLGWSQHFSRDEAVKKEQERLAADQRARESLMGMQGQALQQAIQQQATAFPMQQQVQQFLFNQAQQQAPYARFRDLASTLGGGIGAEAFVAENPSAAQKMFGPSAVPMQGAQGTLPEVAQEAGRRFYNTGPEVARQLNLAGGLFPLQKELADVTHKGRMEEIGLEGKIRQLIASTPAPAPTINPQLLQMEFDNKALTASTALYRPAQALMDDVSKMLAAPETTANHPMTRGKISEISNQINFATMMRDSLLGTVPAGVNKASVAAPFNQIIQQLNQLYAQLWQKTWGAGKPQEQPGVMGGVSDFFKKNMPYSGW